MQQAELVELQEAVYNLCDAISELHKTITGLHTIVIDFDTLSRNYPNLIVQNKRRYGAFVTKVIEILHHKGNWPFSNIVWRLDSWMVNIRTAPIDRQHPFNWIFFFKVIPYDNLLEFFEYVKAVNTQFRAKREKEFAKYSNYKRFPALFVEKYKKDIDQFLLLEQKIDELLVHNEDLLLLIKKDEKKLMQLISSQLARRYRYILNLSSLNHILQGKLFITIIFDYHGKHLFDVTDGAQEVRDWVNFFLSLSQKYSLSFPELTAANAIMIKETIETLLEREGKLFSNLYFADKLNLTLNLYIVEKYRHRGFVLTSHHKRFKGMRVEFNQNQRSLNVFINVAKLKSWFELYKQNQYNIYNDFSLTLIHELAHLKDPRLSQHQLTLLGELAERYRSEGIALYSEYLASKKSAQIAFSWHVIYSANPLDSYAMMKEIKDKNEDHIYWLGFHMAITIVGAALFSKFNIQKSSFNADFMNDIRLLNKSYTPFIRDYIRILRNMNLTLFFKKYIQAAAYLKILPIFTPKFVEIILTRVK